MKRFAVFTLVIIFALSARAEKLSRTIEFDRYLMHARSDVSRGDYRAAVSNYERASKLDTDPNEGFYLDYAASLGALGRWKSAKAVLNTYFKHYDKQGRYYDIALRRYVEAEDKVSRKSEERIRPELQGMSVTSVSKPTSVPDQPAWAPQRGPAVQAAASLPPVSVRNSQREETPQEEPRREVSSANGRAALERLIGSYSGDAKDGENIARSATCDNGDSPGRAHAASDCFYGYHRSMSLNSIEGSGVVGFVKVDYVREHKPASTGDPRDERPTTYQQMEYYISIRLWVTSGGLIQGQQKALCEFVVAQKSCSQTARSGMTPLRAKITADGGLALESEKGGGPRVYLKVNSTPDVVRTDVVHAVPALGPFVVSPSGEYERPTEVEAKPTALGDTADRGDVGDEMDDLAAARFSASAS